MAITLADAARNTQDDYDATVIDEFRKSSYLFDRLTFDDSVSPNGGGATLTYSYRRLTTQRSAAFRKIGQEYQPEQVATQKYSVDLKPLGGSFTLDRVIARLGPAASNEVTLQMQQLIKATRARFADEVINGDDAVDEDGFDGLDKALTGSTTEYDPLDHGVTAGYVDLTAVDTKAEALAAIRMINAWLGTLDGRPDALFGSTELISYMTVLAAWVDQLGDRRDDFGQPIAQFRGIDLVDLGEKAGSNTPVIGTYSADADGGGGGGTITGLSDLYAVRFGLDAFHAVSVNGPIVSTWLPKWGPDDGAGANKSGEAELGPAAAVLKATKGAGVFRKFKAA